MSTLTPTEVVLSFLKDWETGFVAAFEKWLAPDALWQNTGFPDMKGHQAYMALLQRYQEVIQLPYGRAEIISIAENGDKVLTERIDHLWDDGEGRHSTKIMGTFEVAGGKITRYSDYFNAPQFNPEQF